jgi:hypothetical protein
MKTRIERDLSNLRKFLRKRMEWLARSHRGCSSPRGCGCSVDKSLAILEKAELDLFQIEIWELSSHKEPEVVVMDKTKGGAGAISGKK